MKRLVSGDVTTVQVEQRYLSPDGQPVWVLVSASVVSDDAGRPLYIISHVVDIDERKHCREQQLQWHAERDNVTGLWNRHRFEQELEERGHDSVWLPEHSHIPVERKPTRAFGDTVPECYRPPAGCRRS